MGLYKNEAIKICKPEETIKRCVEVIKKFKLEENGIIGYDFRNEAEFGLWAATLVSAQEKLYEFFPDDFPYLKDAKSFWFKKVSGKGVSKTQCTASLFMEFFERLSIELKIYQISSQRAVKKYYDYISELKNQNSFLFNHMENVLSSKSLQEETSFIEVKDILTNENHLFPIKLLFHGSNGYSAGNDEKEAIVHAIFEIVERFSQTLFIIKQTLSSKNDLITKSKKQFYSYDPNLFDEISKFEPFIVSKDSIEKEFPDLGDIIVTIEKNFDKFEVIDASFDINGIRFHNYIVRQGKNDTNFKLFSSGGCHFDQRIALLRALTEAGQGYVSGEKLNQSWNGYLFTRKFIEIVYNSELEEKSLLKDKRIFNEMDEIYNECLKAFKSILVFDCTNDKLNIPAYSVYIPELYSKSFLWSNIFCTSHVGDSDLIRVLGEQKISSVYNFITEKSISGIESLFFLENHNQLAENIREEIYNLYLSYLNDKELFEYIVSKEEDEAKKTSLKTFFEGVKEAEISTVFSMDKNDEESFVFFNNILKKVEKSEDDYLYLIENYSRIGLLDYAVFFAEKNGFSIDEITDEYLPLYEELLNYSKFSNMFRRSSDLLRKIYRLKNDSTLLDIAKEFIESDEKTKKQLSRMIVEKDKKRIFFGLEIGDKILEWRLDSVYQVGDYVYKYNFKNEKAENMPILVSIVKNDLYKSISDNGYYLDYNIGFFNAGKKKIVSEFIDIIEQFP